MAADTESVDERGIWWVWMLGPDRKWHPVGQVPSNVEREDAEAMVEDEAPQGSVWHLTRVQGDVA